MRDQYPVLFRVWQDSFFIWKNQDMYDLNYENDTVGAQQQNYFNLLD